MEDALLSARGEQTREKIIRTAYALFLSNGYHATSMRLIARQADLAVASLYNHFKCKEDIFLAVLQSYHPLFEVLPALSQSHGNTVEEFVRNAAHYLVDNLSRRQDFLNLIFIELVEFRAQHLPAVIEANMPQTVAFAQKFLDGKDDLRPIPLYVLVCAFLGLFFLIT